MGALRRWAGTVKRDVIVLFLAARDPRVPWYAKFTAGCVAAYALSPIDLIPDFIPVLGYVDDLIIVPLGILLAVRLVPADVLAELRSESESRFDGQPASRSGAVAIVVVWLAAAAALAWAFADALLTTAGGR